MRHRRRGLRAQYRPAPDRRRAPPRVPRLRFDRPRDHRKRQRRGAPVAARQHRARRRPRGAGRGSASRRRHRHLAHALGDARRADAGQRAPASVRRRNRRRPQRHHRELRGAARRGSSAQGYAFATQTDSEVIAHLVHAHWHGAAKGDLLARRAARRRRIPRRLRDRGDLGARARPRHRRAAGEPDGRRHRRRTITSSPPTPRRCCRSRDGSPISKKATSPTSVANRMRSTPPAARASSARSSPSKHRARPSSWDRTGTSCRRRSSSSRARWPTRSKSVGGIGTELFGAKAGAMLGANRQRADPRLRHQLLLEPGREAVDRIGRAAFRARSRSPANTATATACQTRTRW